VAKPCRRELISRRSYEDVAAPSDKVKGQCLRQSGKKVGRSGANLPFIVHEGDDLGHRAAQVRFDDMQSAIGTQAALHLRHGLELNFGWNVMKRKVEGDQVA